MKVLILEDNDRRNARFESVCEAAGIEFIMTETAADCIAQLERERGFDFDLVFLDHDLGGQEFVDPSLFNTGTRVARWMAESCANIPVIIHSMNTPAAMGMERILVDGNMEMVFRIPWLQLTHSLPTIIDDVRGHIES